MPNNGDVSGYTGVFRLASPSDPHRKVIKRNRQVVSCVPCRNRKLKCDRQQPCASCVRRHDEGSCRFFSGGGGGGGGDGAGAFSLSSPGRGGGSGHGAHHHHHHVADMADPLRRREVQAKLQMLESMVSGLISGRDLEQGQGPQANAAAMTPGEVGRGGGSEHSDEGSAQSTSQVPRVGANRGGGHLSRHGDEVRFVGATNYLAVLDGIRDLRGYVDVDADDPPAAAGSSSPRHHQRADDQPLGPGRPVTTSEIMDNLPSRAECDAILTFYFQQIYMIPVLIHSGQFQRAYEKFWEDPEGTSLLWTSILFTLLSTSMFQQAAKTLDNDDDSSTVGPDVKERIAGLSSIAYRCLLAGEHLQSKPFCVEATILFGMHLVLQKRDAEPLCWHSIGTAVRLAQRMGYHRDASNLGRDKTGSVISPFDAEMRRRTWYTLEYFDLVQSFQMGVPPIIQGDDVDTRLPANLRDEEFNEDTKTLPQARPTLDFTPILGFIFYSRQVRLLRRIYQLALAVTQPSYTDVVRLDADLRTLHEDVPPSLRYRPIRESGFADVPDVIMRRMLCEMLHLKCLVVLHRRYLTLERENSMYDGLRKACMEASLRLLDLQAEFDEQSVKGGRLYEKRYMLTNTGYHDFLVAAMCICLDLIAGSQASSQHDHERKVESLKRACMIWSKTADRSTEAAHATNVLQQMLSKISHPDPNSTETRTSLRANDGQRFAASAAATAAATTLGPGPPGRDANPVESQTRRRGERQISPSKWPTVNSSAASRAPSKSYSVEWSYEWLDNLGMPKDKAGDAPLDSMLQGEVDWNLVDSFLLDREHTNGRGATRIVPVEDSGGTNQRASREGWPYMQYSEPAPQHDQEKSPQRGPRFRTWSRAGVSLGGFGPST